MTRSPLTGSSGALVSLSSPVWMGDQSLDAFGPLVTAARKPHATKQAVLLYPNPSTRWVMLRAGSQPYSEVEVVNSLGAWLYRSLLKEQALDLRGLPPGVYYVRLHGAGYAHQTKLVLQ